MSYIPHRFPRFYGIFFTKTKHRLFFVEIFLVEESRVFIEFSTAEKKNVLKADYSLLNFRKK